MAETGGEPCVRIVLVAADREIPLGAFGAPTAPGDLGLIDGILRLRLAATRRGWSIRLTWVRDDLRELIDLAGLTDCLGL